MDTNLEAIKILMFPVGIEAELYKDQESYCFQLGKFLFQKMC